MHIVGVMNIKHKNNATAWINGWSAAVAGCKRHNVRDERIVFVGMFMHFTGHEIILQELNRMSNY